ncbi:MAG: hypothetical protein RhofKO_31760 [Rhodothermales bacterium]
MDTAKPGRGRFSKKEIGSIVGRATELHEEARGETEETLSLDEIEEIGDELGVPAEYLREAAGEMARTQSVSGEFSFWGGPFIVDQVFVVDETISDDQWEEIVLELRRATGGFGEFTGVGQTREWSRSSLDGVMTKTRVSVTPRTNGTTVRIHKQFGVAAFMAYLAAIIPVMVLSSVMLTDGGANPFIGIGLCLAILGTVRTMVARWTRQQNARIEALSDFIVQTLSTGVPSSAAGMPSQDLVQVPEFDDLEESSEVRKARVRSR